jgi:putative membrane protein
MKRTMQGVLLAGTLLLGGAALADDKSQAATGGAGKAGKGMAEHQGFRVPADERAFLERLHHGNQQEIKISQLAQQNASSPEVKSYAEQMVKEHTAANQKLMSYAQARGIKLAERLRPMDDRERKIMDADRAVMEKLQTLQGVPFDSSYMSQQVGEHDHMLGKVMAARQAGFASPELSSLLDEQSRTISQHRQRAYQVLGQVGPAQARGVGGAGQQQGELPGHAPDSKQQQQPQQRR